MKTNQIQSRALSTEKISIRAADDGKQYIEGYAIVFNQRSKLIHEWGEKFYEIISPLAVDKVLATGSKLNTIATIDHDRHRMLGRVKSGTLQLQKDERGLKYIIEVPDTTLGRDTAAMVARGDYFESSFIFTTENYTDQKEGNTIIRTINEIRDLFDISIVIDGAYANTAIKLRAAEWTLPAEESGKNQTDILKKKIEIHKLS
jgi:HK97 family phage prohead protease